MEQTQTTPPYALSILRAPVQDGRDSGGMTDTVPEGWRTLWTAGRIAVRLGWNVVRHVCGARAAPGRSDSTHALSTATVRPFGQRERCGGPRAACDAKDKDVLRLHVAGGVRSRRQLARVVGCGKAAVSNCLGRARVAGLTDWAVVAALNEGEFEARLYPTQGNSTLKGRGGAPGAGLGLYPR